MLSLNIPCSPKTSSLKAPKDQWVRDNCRWSDSEDEVTGPLPPAWNDASWDPNLLLLLSLVGRLDWSLFPFWCPYAKGGERYLLGCLRDLHGSSHELVL